MKAFTETQTDSAQYDVLRYVKIVAVSRVNIFQKQHIQLSVQTMNINEAHRAAQWSLGPSKLPPYIIPCSYWPQTGKMWRSLQNHLSSFHSLTVWIATPLFPLHVKVLGEFSHSCSPWELACKGAVTLAETLYVTLGYTNKLNSFT